jgi:hypothetical protein
VRLWLSLSMQAAMRAVQQSRETSQSYPPEWYRPLPSGSGNKRTCGKIRENAPVFAVLATAAIT